MITNENMKLYATNEESNWDLYQSESGYLYSIAKPGTGCEISCWGWPEHLDKLTRCGINHGFKVITKN